MASYFCKACKEPLDPRAHSSANADLVTCSECGYRYNVLKPWETVTASFSLNVHKDQVDDLLHDVSRCIFLPQPPIEQSVSSRDFVQLNFIGQKSGYGVDASHFNRPLSKLVGSRVTVTLQQRVISQLEMVPHITFTFEEWLNDAASN